MCSTSVFGAAFTVNNPGDFIDNNPGDGVCLGGSPIMACGLRAAIMEANALAGAHTINLPAGHYKLAIPGTGEDLGAEGDLDVFASRIELLGAGAAVTLIDADGIDRVFDVHSLGILHAEDVTITGGRVAGNGLSGSGGGILTRDLGLLLLDSAVEGNQATSGGGIYTAAEALFIQRSAIRNNVVESFGSTVASGAGIKAASPLGNVFVAQSAVTGNRCGPGGAAGCNGAAGVSMTCSGTPSPALFLFTSTVSGNTPRGVWLDDCDAEVRGATIVDNPGGGLTFFETHASGLILFVSNSIVSNNAPDCNLLPGTTGQWAMAGHRNLDSDGSCPISSWLEDLPGTDPMLHPLGHFDPPSGHVGRSHHPKWDSPVVDAGTLDTVSNPVEDQDGYPRPLDTDTIGVARYDLGSIEVLPCDSPDPDVTLEIAFPGGTAEGTTIEACRTITTGSSVTVQDVGPVRFWARDSIVFGNGFSVVDGADFAAGLVRWAGYTP